MKMEILIFGLAKVEILQAAAPFRKMIGSIAVRWGGEQPEANHRSVG